MAWWIPMAISAASTVMQGISSSNQNKEQQAWNQYNATMGYETSLANIESNRILGQFNAGMQMQAGRFNANLDMMSGEMSAEMAELVAQYNAAIIAQTTNYNTELLEDELAMLWEAAELDLLHLGNQRLVERGQIEGVQASSGTIMGQDSNADVIISQKTQESLDAFVIRHNANRAAESIKNQIDENVYNGQVAWQQTMFNGAMDAFTARTNSAINAAGTLANASLSATSILGQTGIQGYADLQSSRYQYTSGMAGAEMTYGQNQNTITNNVTTGLFSAAANGASKYYSMKSPQVTSPVQAGSAGTSLVSGA